MSAKYRLTILTILLCTLLSLYIGVQANQPVSPEMQTFIDRVESLVLNTTDRALMITRNAYLNISQEMPSMLLQATNETMQKYIWKANEALNDSSNTNFTMKRQLLRQFRVNNLQIELLRRQLTPLHPELNFQLISEDFYSSQKNITEFDNLYMWFMGEFADASKKLWDSLSEATVEEQQEMLELLDEISKEQQVREKDKLYDEFIAMFLFKVEEDEAQKKELY
ncbi:uncharacterized protein [Eurosta solidaginis]|uniref:uncharacterized protein n=1 Tax=Eurosta solidaginis TaxID=178769 RepID=UPI0035315C62